jgi:hypothetical protein
MILCPDCDLLPKYGGYQWAIVHVATVGEKEELPRILYFVCSGVPAKLSKGPVLIRSSARVTLTFSSKSKRKFWILQPSV